MSCAGKQLTLVDAAAFRESVQVQLLRDDHRAALADFDCHPEVNKFLKFEALQAATEGFTVTWLFLHDGAVVAYVGLANASVKLDIAERKGLALNPNWDSWPALLIGYLGVDKRYRGRGLGDHLLNFALGEAQLLGERVGCKFLVADVFPEEHAIAMYERNGFKRGNWKDYRERKHPKYWRVLTSNPTVAQLDTSRQVTGAPDVQR